MTERLRVRPSAVLVVGLLAAILTLVAPQATPAASAATGSCRAVSGTPAATGGPQRATVVVDTGSGAVWSACISFSGAISGVDALELAKAQIPGLAPVYDIYAGQGRAVCRLRGVGNDPPDCLGKTVEYWGYFRNGRYSPAGAGAVTVRDGDVEAWRWGTSGASPRRATDGYEAAAYVAPPPTAAPTTRPPAPPATAAPQPPAGSPATRPPSGNASPAQPQASPGPALTTSTVAAAGSTPSTGPSSSTTTAVATDSSEVEPQATGDPDVAVRPASGDDELAVGTPGSPGGPSLDDPDGASSAGSIVAFAAALVAVGGVGLVLRRRRNAVA
jgi:hypothetical protein